MIPTKITWTDAYSVGVPELDEQHKVLIDIINEVAGFGATANPSESFHNILAALFDYVEKHFATEQAYMRMIRYPDYQDHVAHHEDFLNQLDTLSARAMENKLHSVELHRFLSVWLTEHVMEEDQQYRRYYETRPPDGTGRG